MSSKNGRVAIIATQREALELYRQGKTRKDIAAELGVKFGTLMSWLIVADAVDPEGDEFIPLTEVRVLAKVDRHTLGRLKASGQLVVTRRNGKNVVHVRELELLQRRVGRWASKRGTARR